MIKVFIIDDSASVRNGFINILSSASDIEILGVAENPIDAFEVFKKVGLPDIFILDIEMPRMDGLTFLKQINAQRPTPVIICSTLVGLGEPRLIDAMRLGAAEIIEKPKNNLSEFFLNYKEELISKIRAVSKANIYCSPHINLSRKKVKKIVHIKIASSKVVVIGSSTGGTQVLEEIVTHLNSEHIGIIVVQHIPKGFSASLASRLDDLSIHSVVKEAEEGELIVTNTIYIAPGGVHLEVEKEGLKYFFRLKDFPKVNSHRPSINVLFNSVAKTFKANSVGFILTGMGDDGATGLKKMFDAGALTYTQNEQSSTIYGMPKVAYELGGSLKPLSIYEVIKVINES